MSAASDEPPDEVRLTLPALAPYARLARQCAAGLALRRRFGPRSVEDLRLAVDEALVTLLEQAVSGARLEVIYRLMPDGLVVSASLRTADGVAIVPTDAGRTRFDLLATELVESPQIDGRGVISFAKHR